MEIFEQMYDFFIKCNDKKINCILFLILHKNNIKLLDALIYSLNRNSYN